MDPRLTALQQLTNGDSNDPRLIALRGKPKVHPLMRGIEPSEYEYEGPEGVPTKRDRVFVDQYPMDNMYEEFVDKFGIEPLNDRDPSTGAVRKDYVPTPRERPTQTILKEQEEAGDRRRASDAVKSDYETSGPGDRLGRMYDRLEALGQPRNTLESMPFDQMQILEDYLNAERGVHLPRRGTVLSDEEQRRLDEPPQPSDKRDPFEEIFRR